MQLRLRQILGFLCLPKPRRKPRTRQPVQHGLHAGGIGDGNGTGLAQGGKLRLRACRDETVQRLADDRWLALAQCFQMGSGIACAALLQEGGDFIGRSADGELWHVSGP